MHDYHKNIEISPQCNRVLGYCKHFSVLRIALKFYLLFAFHFDLTDLTVSSLCYQELEEFWPFNALLTELTRRLTYCVQAELIPFTEVAGVMEVRL
jgi:hypothetical protein